MDLADKQAPIVMNTSRTWTYEDYALLPDDGNRYEVIDGVLIMSPAPIPLHQKVSNLMAYYLTTHVVMASIGEVYTAPIDVVLENQIVQPDLLVVLDKGNGRAFIDEKKIIGAPDVIIEIASPGTSSYDRFIKHSRYEQAGVTEYWQVSLFTRTISIHVLQDGKYQLSGEFTDHEPIFSTVIPGINQIPVHSFFEVK
jgi:Uma2 family endonuclease